MTATGDLPPACHQELGHVKPVMQQASVRPSVSEKDMLVHGAGGAHSRAPSRACSSQITSASAFRKSRTASARWHHPIQPNAECYQPDAVPRPAFALCHLDRPTSLSLLFCSSPPRDSLSVCLPRRPSPSFKIGHLLLSTLPPSFRIYDSLVNIPRVPLSNCLSGHVRGRQVPLNHC